MVLKGFNQQRLARASGVSDSEVSRILAGKSQPGLENALKLARAVGISLDYLADPSQDAESPRQAPADPWASEALELIRELGSREAMQLLLAVRTIGQEVALRRLFGVVEPSPQPRLSAASTALSVAESEPDSASVSPIAPHTGILGVKASRGRDVRGAGNG